MELQVTQDQEIYSTQCSGCHPVIITHIKTSISTFPNQLQQIKHNHVRRASPSLTAATAQIILSSSQDLLRWTFFTLYGRQTFQHLMYFMLPIMLLYQK